MKTIVNLLLVLTVLNLVASVKKDTVGKDIDRANHCDVAIIGGGLTGVYTAFRLSEDSNFRGKDICLFEAKNRFGGRIFSLTNKEIPDLSNNVLEAGEYRYHTKLNPIRRILIEDVFNIPNECYFGTTGDRNATMDCRVKKEYLYLRDKLISESDLKTLSSSRLPYNLVEESPVGDMKIRPASLETSSQFSPTMSVCDITLMAIRDMVPSNLLESFNNIESISHVMNRLSNLQYKGMPINHLNLREIMVDKWNVTEEKLRLLEDVKGIPDYSLFLNFNFRDLVKSCLYRKLLKGEEGTYKRISSVKGHYTLIDKLISRAQKNGVKFFLNYKLWRINKGRGEDNTMRLGFSNKERFTTSNLFLTVGIKQFRRLSYARIFREKSIDMKDKTELIDNSKTELVDKYKDKNDSVDKTKTDVDKSKVDVPVDRKDKSEFKKSSEIVVGEKHLSKGKFVFKNIMRSLKPVGSYKMILHYKNAWWNNQNLNGVHIITNDWIKNIRFYSIPVNCSVQSGTVDRAPLSGRIVEKTEKISERAESNCDGYLEVSYNFGGFREFMHVAYIAKRMRLFTVFKDSDPSGLFVLHKVHKKISNIIKNLNIENVNIDKPDFGVFVQWSKHPWYRAGAVVLPNDIKPETWINTLLNPVNRFNIHVVNPDFVKEIGWEFGTDNSLFVIEKLLMVKYGITKPTWMDETIYSYIQQINITLPETQPMHKFPKTSPESTTETVVPKPSTDKTSTDKPSTDKPSTDRTEIGVPKPLTDKPSTDKPSGKPSTDKPSGKPSTDKPSTDKPSDKPLDKPSGKPSTVETPSVGKRNVESSRRKGFLGLQQQQKLKIDRKKLQQRN